ncbi:MAG TPA: hypothetical protein VN455_00985, partial [Methanotrichaceae archaeon]|nr:hypothetical protein [Methanotrichaceae archaeon]
AYISFGVLHMADNRFVWDEEDLIIEYPDKLLHNTKAKKNPKEAITEAAEALAAIYVTGQDEIHDVILAAISDGDLSHLQKDIKAIRADLLAQGKEWAGSELPALYVAGASQIAPPKAKGHQKAIAASVGLMTAKLREADAAIAKYADATIARLRKLEAKGDLDGEDWLSDEYGDIEEELKDGIPAHKSISGALLTLAPYAAMLAITASRDSYNEGVENSILEAQDGSDLAQISEEVRPNSCEACREWAGTVISLHGLVEGYPTYDESVDAGIWHPSCIHFLQPFER